MCGISGWKVDPSLSDRFKHESDGMIKRLIHRGPDGSGQYHSLDNTLYLGHTRLSIIDLSDLGTQPMISERGDVMVFNGEIYNFLELKKELIGRGHVFTSETDSEVLLNSFVEWGIGCLEKIHGMYAFALWDAEQNVMHLARDPMGIKPLYYWLLPNKKGLVFASEVRAFLGLPGFDKKVNRNSLGQYLEFGYTFNQEETIFEDVYKTPPGHRLEVRAGQVRRKVAFYSPANVIPTDRRNIDTEALLYTTLSKVISEHLVADVPVGLLLSGGLDSSLIAAIASQHRKINTFSMGFANSSVDERPFARMVSKHIGSEHKEVLIQPSEILEDLESVVANFDDLFADWGMVSTRLLYKKCQEQGIKVVVVGEGSDELFGGYDVFHQSLALQNKPLEWQIFQLYRSYSGRRYGHHYGQFRVVIKSFLEQCNNDLFAAVRLFESRHQMPNNYVMKVDKASMSLSVEARTPFLDSRIADIAYQTPASELLSCDDEKLMLKSIARRYKLLPEEIINRRKFGSGIASNWMDDKGDFRDFAKETILSPSSWIDELGLRDAMQRYFLKSESGYAFPRSISIFRNLAWKLLVLNLWSESLQIPITHD